MKPSRLLPFAVCLALTACGEGQNTRDLLGLGRNAPDEFKVALSQVEKELITAGFTIEKIDKDALDYQYIILAVKPKEPKNDTNR